MSDWAGPPQSSDTPRRPTDGVDALLTKLTELKRGLRDLPSGLLKQAGISISPEGMTIDSALTVTGDTRIEGTLSLPQGIIDNDALAQPVTFASAWDSATNFTVPEGWKSQASCSLTVPEGFSTIQYQVTATITARNSTASTQYLYGRVSLIMEGDPTVYDSATVQITLPAGFWGTVSSPWIWSVKGVPGVKFQFSADSWGGGGGFSAHAEHYARIEASGTFSR